MKYVYLINEGSRASEYGIGTYIREMINYLQNAMDVSLSIIQFHSDVKEFSIERRHNCLFYLIPSNYITSKFKSEKYYRNAWYLLKFNIQFYEDAIFHLNYGQEYSLISLMRSMCPKCKIVFTIHYQDWCFSLKGNLEYFRQIIKGDRCDLTCKELEVLNDYQKEKKLYENVDKIVCLADFTLRVLEKDYQICKDKLILICNSLKDEGNILSKDQKRELKQKWLFSEKEKIVLYVGRLDEIKGLHVLIKSFKNLISIHPEIRLVIIGDGDFSVYLRECSPYWNKITFTGRLNKDELYQFYQIADIGVMLSLHEQCSYVAIEMMMFGLPIVTTDTTGLNEMIIDEVLKIKVSYFNDEVSIPIDKCVSVLSSILDGKLESDNRSLFVSNYMKNEIETDLYTCYS